jgi:DNA mismatch endonuclease (patch repair protein)
VTKEQTLNSTLNDAARSAQMARIRHKDTKPEMRVRKALHASGLRYRLHDRRLPGRPDLLFPSRKLALFVNGCFFHQHPGCPRARMPKTRLDFWGPKLQGNVARDHRNWAEIRAMGWQVMVFWECETMDANKIATLVQEISHYVSPRKENGNQRLIE